MIRTWYDDGWRRRFALFPIFLSDGPVKQMIWLQWVWKRDMGLYGQVSTLDPRRDSDGSPKGGNAAGGAVHDSAGATHIAKDTAP